MDNKALAQFIKTELSRAISRIETLVLKVGHPRQQDETRAEPAHGTDNQRSDTRPAVPAPAPANSKQSKRSVNTPRPRRKITIRLWRQFKRLFLKKDRLERVAFIAGISYAAVTFVQWRDLRHNFAADQRAWIRVEINMPVTLTSDFAILGQMRNVGKSPASKVDGQIVVQIVNADEAPSFNGQVHQYVWTNIVFPSDFSEFSTGRTPNNTDGSVRPLDAEEMRRLSSGTAYLAVFGVVTYRDYFGDHWTRFCVPKGYQTGVRQYSSKSCVGWNDVGEGPIGFTGGPKETEKK